MSGRWGSALRILVGVAVGGGALWWLALRADPQVDAVDVVTRALAGVRAGRDLTVAEAGADAASLTAVPRASEASRVRNLLVQADSACVELDVRREDLVVPVRALVVGSEVVGWSVRASCWCPDVAWEPCALR